MKTIFFITALLLFQISYAQNDLLDELKDKSDSVTQLLPPKMLITQRILWGQKGLMRPIVQLNMANREKELKVRRAMLVAHQILGFVTLGGMVGQGITGSQLYKGDYRIKDLHEGLATTVNLTYGATAAMSFFAPPPLINRDKKLSAIRLHKLLSIVHLAGMITTNVLAENAPKAYHRAAAIATFASFGAAIISVKF
ncbi:MAG: hypothetical protein RL634_1014 [Bacteroidota bacterium]|jgi:hypothetical protein